MEDVKDPARELELALADQARLGEAYERAVGTSAELSAYLELRAVGERVAFWDQRLRATAAGTQFAITVRGGAHAPREARRAAIEQVGSRLGADALAALSLLVSEVVTNCVVHGGADDGRTIELVGSFGGDSVHVEVSAEGPAFEHSPKVPSADAAGGRGLYIVDTLADSWGIDALPPPTVWFEMPRTACL